ncbi:MAG: aminotransferase class I/II-fold pyridoxal phosphate-dependent enzyme, partial [Kiritimatiellae bacterium]|nr:aminotransferase class I/II-fold pyridoxal phosphate-dependent enzyme [Kiritimatiellia bacterium]
MSLIRESVLRMKGYTPGEQPADPGIVKLNTNENPYPPSPAVGDALRRLDPAALGRYPDPVCRRLRKRIASMHGLTPERIFVGNGSDEVLALCVRAFVRRPGGTVGSFEPSYSLYPVLAAIEDVPWEASPLGPEYEWQPPRNAPGVFFLTHPNAPTGMVYPRERIEEFCRAFPGVVVVDEAYVDFADAHLMDLIHTHPNVLVARTLSKSYSLAGLRVGYLAGAEDLIAALYKIKDSYNVDRLAQEIAYVALGDGG